MNKPFFSIVVVSLNAETTITHTINSVLSQSFDDYEIIVKDGLSKDNTVKNIPESDKIKTYEQADKGIYDAMNQGIEYANGKFVCFLNCGDFFADNNVLGKIYEVAKENDEAVIYGNYLRKGVLFKQPSNISPFYLYRTPLCHQTMFISKKLFETNGLYDTQFKILADYEHTLKDYFSETKFVYCDYPVCGYMGEGVSESKKGKIIKNKERKKIIKEYYSKKNIVWNEFKIFVSMRKLRQAIVSDKSPEWIRKLYRKLVNKING